MFVVCAHVLKIYSQHSKQSQPTGFSHFEWDWLTDFAFLKVALSVWNCHHAIVAAHVISRH